MALAGNSAIAESSNPSDFLSKAKNSYINKDYYGGYMFTLSINYESKEDLYASAMMGAGEILEGPVGSRGTCDKI